MLESQNNGQARVGWNWKGKTYSMPLTQTDVLDWGRAVEQEGRPEEAVAWTLLQRAMWSHMSQPAMTLGTMARAYAQPINPAWFPDGPKHQQEILRLERLGDIAGMNAENRRADLRPAMASKPWLSLRQSTRDVLWKILSNGQQTPVSGAVHYWASRGPDFATNQAAKPELILLNRGYPFGKGWNVFFGVKGSDGFGALNVKNAKYAWPGGSASGASTPPIFPILVGAVVGYTAWKWLYG